MYIAVQFALCMYIVALFKTVKNRSTARIYINFCISSCAKMDLIYMNCCLHEIHVMYCYMLLLIRHQTLTVTAYVWENIYSICLGNVFPT